jgi:hypothetical protein
MRPAPARADIWMSFRLVEINMSLILSPFTAASGNEGDSFSSGMIGNGVGKIGSAPSGVYPPCEAVRRK